MARVLCWFNWHSWGEVEYPHRSRIAPNCGFSITRCKRCKEIR